MHCDMNFATEHRFRSNLLLYGKVGHNSISNGIIVTNYFDITRIRNYNRNEQIGRLMGRIETVVGVTMATL